MACFPPVGWLGSGTVCDFELRLVTALFPGRLGAAICIAPFCEFLGRSARALDSRLLSGCLCDRHQACGHYCVSCHWLASDHQETVPRSFALYRSGGSSWYSLHSSVLDLFWGSPVPGSSLSNCGLALWTSCHLAVLCDWTEPVAQSAALDKHLAHSVMDWARCRWSYCDLQESIGSCSQSTGGGVLCHGLSRVLVLLQ